MAASSRARFLYPEPQNSTLCHLDCTPACAFYYLCSPPPLPPFPPLNMTTGPKSPPPPPATPAAGNSTPIRLPHHSLSLLPRLLIAGGSLLGASLLLLLLLFALLRVRRRRRLRAQDAQNPDAHVANFDDGDDFFDGGEADHHVWYIRTVGLDERTIRGIAALTYKAGDGLLGGASDCPVCLAEFRDGELLRLLPKCGHAFHLACIDTWLRSHVNCPLCRAPVVAPLAAAPLAAADVTNVASGSSSSRSSSSAAAADPGDPNSGSSPSVENTQIVISPLEVDQMAREEETDSGEIEIGDGIEIVIDPTSAASSSRSSIFELGGSNELDEDVLQSIRRSVSMDSSSLAALLIREDAEQKSSAERKEPDFEEERVIDIGDKQENASKEASLQKGPLDMERSLSGSGGRFFLSRHGRARKAVLPL